MRLLLSSSCEVCSNSFAGQIGNSLGYLLRMNPYTFHPHLVCEVQFYTVSQNRSRFRIRVSSVQVRSSQLRHDDVQLRYKFRAEVRIVQVCEGKNGSSLGSKIVLFIEPSDLAFESPFKASHLF